MAAKGTSTGWINARAGGGNGKYLIEWYSGGIIAEAGKISADTTTLFSGIKAIPAGEYLIRVKDTASCRFWATEWLEKKVTVPEPAKSLELRLKNKRQVSCYGKSDGSFVFEGSG
ncbi:MAG: hypothetical protein HC905_05585, partial [Bacteroidales bacterium]|nr:hypothetical protein [Bacteroidales bacterium]